MLSSGRMALAVVGTSRSGTSLLAALLNEHSGLVVESEVFQRSILLGEDDPWRRADPLSRYAAFLRACDARAEAVGTERFWGNKMTTEVMFFGGGRRGVAPRAAVGELVAAFPPVPVLFIVRDGRAVVASKMARAGTPLDQACRQWVMSFSFLEAFAEGAQPTLTVRYEDLVRQPEPTLRSVCGFLGVPYDPQMASGTRSELLLPEYRHDGFVTEKAEPVGCPDAALPFIAETLERWGYR